jgi:hypothetical protein
MNTIRDLFLNEKKTDEAQSLGMKCQNKIRTL